MIEVAVALGVFCFVPVIMYNTLISKKNSVANSFSSIDVQLKLRHDLIPNLVGAVKGYMEHERATLESLARLRSEAMNARMPVSQRAAVESELGKALGNVMVLAEGYPQLKAESSFVMLQKSLNEVEAQISAARRTYNAAVTELNNSIEMFPSSIMAKWMKYQQAPLFEAHAGKRTNPSVNNMMGPS